jgi:hypothetical protein
MVCVPMVIVLVLFVRDWIASITRLSEFRILSQTREE